MSFHVEAEIASQPDCWSTAVDRAARVADRLPKPGERVAFIGCGTSWFVGQVIAHWRESRGLGESDAYTASEALLDRGYDRVVALSRSGTTTEVLEVLTRLRGRVPTVAVTGDLSTPVVDLADEIVDLAFADEQSVVQTRFATSTLALFRSAFGDDLDPLIAAAKDAVAAPLPEGLSEAEQLTFLGRGWSVGIAHEAALKFRETSSSWAESYPAMDYRHGPISIANKGRAVWMFGEPPAGLVDDVAATGATFVDHDLDPLVDLILAQRVAVARAIGLGVNPDEPRHLSRSVVLDA
ncbi:SIS domain-containing protein [Microlunatus parietis]|uniref:Fructoselysine-6-P-deglycase FrlB-like protein n=1 Tax=Microlunatus parietis TaxID=682979 RepID=A0A7Y9LE65_9ACTN|nr:SIS domain-containing protein [Microlunatus parietis]NYE73560.1 fructoselysine-6-P-deglycase FrlB-like protein [Microlunatus parietis]